MLKLNDPGLLADRCLIGGEWCAADDGATLAVTNPATGAVLARVPKMGRAETRRALEAAEAAWPAWRHRTAKERAVILRRWFDLVTAHADDLAVILTA